MAKVVTGASIPVSFSITCESCGHKYEGKMVLEVGKNLLDEMNPKFDIRKKLQIKYDQMLGGDFSEMKTSFKCPECGYTQSWNVVGTQREQAENTGNIIGAVPALAVAVLVFTQMMGNGFNIGMLLGPVILASFVFVAFQWLGRKLSFAFVFSNIDPNKEYEKAGERIQPVISLQ